MPGERVSPYTPNGAARVRPAVRQPQAAAASAVPLEAEQDRFELSDLAQQVVTSHESGQRVVSRPLPGFVFATGERARFALSTEIVETPDHPLPLSRDSAVRVILQDNDGPFPLPLVIMLYSWVHQNPEIMHNLGITSLETMTPEQAALLSETFVQAQLTYDEATTASDSSDPQAVYDNLTAVGTGVCRHYSIATRTVFNIFRRYAQGALRNAHMMWMYGRADDLGSARTNMHGWLVLLTQTSSDSFVIQAMDPTTEDQRGEFVEAMQDGLGTPDLGTQLELASALYHAGVISSETAVNLLNDYITTYPDSSRLEWAYYYLAEIQPSQAAHYLMMVVELGGSLANEANERLGQM